MKQTKNAFMIMRRVESLGNLENVLLCRPTCHHRNRHLCIKKEQCRYELTEEVTGRKLVFLNVLSHRANVYLKMSVERESEANYVRCYYLAVKMF